MLFVGCKPYYIWKAEIYSVLPAQNRVIPELYDTGRSCAILKALWEEFPKF